MELLLKLTPAADIQQHVLQMLYRGLDSETPQIHELCLAVLPTFAGLLDHASVKNSLLPRIKKLCLSTSSLSVRVNCLLCVGRLLEHLDKWLVLDEILPFLPQIPSREPAVLMGILGIYKLAMNHKKLGISKEIIATRILPFLIPLCIENGLNLTQFNALVVLVKQMFQLVETEHRTKLEQLNTVQEEQKAMQSILPATIPSTKPVELDKAFTGLGLDTFVGTSNSLSMEEKQKLAKQQENIKILQNQPPIEPIPSPIEIKKEAKDLTSTLMHNFSTPVQAAVPPMNNFNKQNVLVNPISPQTSFNNINLMNGDNNFSRNPPNINQNQWGYNQSVGNWQQAANPWASNQASNLNKSIDLTQNWSALDNLLPSSGTNKLTMNQMLPQKQPLLEPHRANNNVNSNKLTNDDILDFLK